MIEDIITAFTAAVEKTGGNMVPTTIHSGKLIVGDVEPDRHALRNRAAQLYGTDTGIDEAVEKLLHALDSPTLEGGAVARFRNGYGARLQIYNQGQQYEIAAVGDEGIPEDPLELRYRLGQCTLRIQAELAPDEKVLPLSQEKSISTIVRAIASYNPGNLQPFATVSYRPG